MMRVIRILDPTGLAVQPELAHPLLSLLGSSVNPEQSITN